MDLINRVDDISVEIELLPSVIQVLIDTLNLDQVNLTDEDRSDIGMYSSEIYDILSLVQLQIERFKKDRNALWKELRATTA